MVKVNVCERNVFDPNSTMITNFMVHEFPELHNGNSATILEGVMTELIGSRQFRLAGRPSPENEVAMRELVRKCIATSHPIPILVVSGPKKSISQESIDVAELSALKILACLNKRIKKHFFPGIVIRLRLEDITGLYLEEGTNGLQESMDRYTGDLEKIIRILDYNFIQPIRESMLVSENDFRQSADAIFSLLHDYLLASEAVDQN